MSYNTGKFFEKCQDTEEKQNTKPAARGFSVPSAETEQQQSAKEDDTAV